METITSLNVNDREGNMTFQDFSLLLLSNQEAWDDFCSQFLTDIQEKETDQFEIRHSVPTLVPDSMYTSEMQKGSSKIKEI